jgi:hypothetical protein
MMRGRRREPGPGRIVRGGGQGACHAAGLLLSDSR